MADAITTTATLKAACLVLSDVVDALIDAAEFDTDATLPHDAAWSAVKRDIKRIRGYDESDLTDSSELQHAVHCKVLQILYDLYGDDEGVERWKIRYWNEIRSVFLTVTGSEQASDGRMTLLVRG